MPPDGCLVVRGDHQSVLDCVIDPVCEVRRYGKGQEWDGRIDGLHTDRGSMTFSVLHKGKVVGTFESIMVGEHNLYNQVALVAMHFMVYRLKIYNVGSFLFKTSNDVSRFGFSKFRYRN